MRHKAERLGASVGDAPESSKVGLPKLDDMSASVLLVDDRPANLIALEAILEPLRVRLVRASSGEEALWRILEEEFALVLLDVQMPGMDGFRVATTIRSRPSTRTLPIIFLTALSRKPSHVFKGYETGAVDYLVKPFDSNVLRSKVSVFVDLFKKTKFIEWQAELIHKKQREELERRGEHRFRNLTESVSDCIWAARVDGELYYANRGARLHSSSLSFLDVIHPEERTAAGEMWRDALNTRQPFMLECRLRNPEAWRWCIVRGVPERDEAGQMVGWIVSATDIDDRRRVEEALRASEHQLRLANEAKDAFMAAASHELRSPLSAMKAQAHLALSKLGNDTSTFPGKGFALMQRQVNRMARLVEDLMDVSRIQHGRLSLQIEEFDLSELAEEVRERVQAISSGHTIRVNVPPGLFLCADRGRLDQVVTNLLTNAIRYSPEGGEVILGAQDLKDEVQLFVEDEGIGIPKEKQRAIFERFGRAHGSKYGGLGLGLTIAEGIVLQHGGRIWVESEGEEGKGSTFFVRLPKRVMQSGREPEGMLPEKQDNSPVTADQTGKVSLGTSTEPTGEGPADMSP